MGLRCRQSPLGALRCPLSTWGRWSHRPSLFFMEYTLARTWRNNRCPCAKKWLGRHFECRTRRVSTLRISTTHRTLAGFNLSLIVYPYYTLAIPLRFFFPTFASVLCSRFRSARSLRPFPAILCWTPAPAFAVTVIQGFHRRYAVSIIRDFILMNFRNFRSFPFQKLKYFTIFALLFA